MDFIEQWLGISPDGGNGLLELAIFVSLAALGLAVWQRKFAEARRRKK